MFAQSVLAFHYRGKITEKENQKKEVPTPDPPRPYSFAPRFRLWVIWWKAWDKTKVFTHYLWESEEREENKVLYPSMTPTVICLLQLHPTLHSYYNFPMDRPAVSLSVDSSY